MAQKKGKVIHLITESFAESALDTLQNLEPGPAYILSGETPDGAGIYLCDQPFTIEEAEAQHLTEEPDAEDEINEIEVPVDTVEEE